MHVHISEQINFNFPILRKSRFPQNNFITLAITTTTPIRTKHLQQQRRQRRRQQQRQGRLCPKLFCYPINNGLMKWLK